MRNQYIILTCIAALLFCGSAWAQFVWMHGTNLINQTGVYGTQGVYNSANMPGGRSGSTTWTDASGIFWLFGGNGYGASGGSGRLSDLWKYDPAANQWMWVKGPSSTNANGTYGTQGVEASGNNPGAREVAANWIDGSGNLWIFAGYGRPATGSTSGYLSDLWRYNPSTNNWTWMHGNTTISSNGVYGTKGTPSSSNMPGARFHSVGCVSTSGNFFLFSGAGYGASGFIPGNTNDLWSYNLSTNQWTWLSGDSTINVTGVYGTQGTSSSSNKPGTRVHAVSWLDASGNLWIFSGHGRASTSTNGYLNDLWKYDISTGYWTWMSGDNVIDQTGVYNDSCDATASNKPGGRYASSFWRDASTGLFWLFSGIGRATSSTVGELNDLWAFDVVSGYWSWTRGNTINQNGTYGTMGTGAPANIPGGRDHSSGWNDATALWTLGGVGYPASGGSGYLNDLWKLPFAGPCDGTPLPVSLTDFSSTHCSSSRVDLRWTMASETNSHYFIVERADTSMHYVEIGNVDASGNSTSEKNYYFTDDEPLHSTAYYRLRQVNFNGQSNIIGRMLQVNCTSAPELFRIWPNPNNGKLFSITIPENAGSRFVVSITNPFGNTVWAQEFDASMLDNNNTATVNTATNFPEGIYFIKIDGAAQHSAEKFFIRISE